MGVLSGDKMRCKSTNLLNTNTRSGSCHLAARELGITPLAHVVVVHIVEVGLGQGNEAMEVVLVLGLHIGDSEASGSLLAHDSTETRLALHNAVWHTTRLAKAREPHDDLNRIDIVSDHHELGLLLFDEASDVVHAHLHSNRLLRRSLTTGGNFLGLLRKALLRLRLEVVEETEKLRRLTLVEGVAELVDCRRDLDALQERHLAALQADVLGPFHEANKVTLGGEDISSDGECAWLLLHSRARELDLRRGRLCHLLHHCLYASGCSPC